MEEEEKGNSIPRKGPLILLSREKREREAQFIIARN